MDNLNIYNIWNIGFILNPGLAGGCMELVEIYRVR
jgi:hypothetical protein